MVDGKPKIARPFVAASLPGVKGTLGPETKKPESGKPFCGKTVCPNASTVVPDSVNVNTVCPDHTSLSNNDFGSSESESLLSELEAAK